MKIERRCMGMGVRKKRHKHMIILLSSILIVLFIVFCVSSSIQTNRNKISQQAETYAMGETVDIGPNFFSDFAENPNGYTIRINSAELADYEECLANYGISAADYGFSEGYPPPQYTCLLNVTIANADNDEGAIMALNYALYNQALKIPVDYSLWGLMDEHFTGEPGFRLLPNTEVNITIPFTPMPSDTGTANEKVAQRMESGEFYFCVSEFPVRKQIKIIMEN